jgi:uncharacterized repeat protein (TIGR01451 family)
MRIILQSIAQLRLAAAWLIVACAVWWIPSQAFANSPGKNGTVTIAALNTIVNQSSTLSIAASAGSSTITVANIANLSSPEPVGGGALAVGDVVLIYQARGATINTANSTTYGDITSYGNAGNYEFQTVARVSGNDIGLLPLSSGNSCTAGALKRSYDAGAQVIRVPQYAALTVNAGASIATLAWNGSVGGVVAIRVQNTLTLNGSITVAGLGFRGGPRDGNDRNTAAANNFSFVSDDNPAGGAKGEGIASGAAGTFGGIALPFSNPGGNFDIGAAANGGGGGGSHNAGGGGGANAASALTPYCTTGVSTYTSVPTRLSATTTFNWCGQGSMPNTVTGSTAWLLDPGYRANGNAVTAQVGGGRGGYSFANSNQDALSVAPGTTTWGGDGRHPSGGWGGRPLQQDLPNRAFFGGGGGAGANNNNTGSDGAAGGGLIFIEAGNLSGSGALIANGNTAANTSGGHNDAPGGGGAGGSIIVRSGGGSVGSMQASGGNGGNQLITGTESEGPGGGAGGGLIAVFNAGGTQAANGGVGGVSNSSSVTEFPTNGATNGSAGLTAQSAPELIFPRLLCAELTISKTNSTATLVAGASTTYTIVISNGGPDAANGSLLRDPAVTGLSCTAVSCTSAIGTTCAVSAPPANVTVANLQGSGIPISSFPARSSLTFTVSCGVTASGVP